jgi:hypothetical protein
MNGTDRMRAGVRAAFLALMLAMSVLPADRQAGAAAPSAQPAPWTLILQLPAAGPLQVERTGGSLRGSPALLLRRLRRSRGGLGGIRQVAAGTISIKSGHVRDLQIAGKMLIVTVIPPPNQRVHVVSTNRLPFSEDPSHRALVDMQLLAGNELHARAPFAVVDERGRTAVLFQ